MKQRQATSTHKHPTTASLFWRALLTRTSRSSLAALALSGSFPMAGALRADPLPTGQQIERGNGTVSGDANTLTVRTNGRTVISWQTFNIGGGKTVDFQNDKAVLNYVRRGGGSSQIDGTLRATNPIILLNNQGITVGSTAVISVPSILLSTGSLLSDSMDKFIQGANYGNGLNAPLIGIQLSNGDGPISLDGVIKSTNGGGIGLIAPSLTVGPNAKIRSTGSRSEATITDGVNTTVNGVVAKGSLWLGTTALSLTSYTQPIPGMPGASLPTLPTGFGFTQVLGKPSPQSIQLSLQATYDFERVVIGSSGAIPGQFDSLFFSPNFRATDFYVYDGIQAIEEGHRQATSGGLRRTLVDAQTNQLIDDQLESTLLGLQLPSGATLLAADRVVLDANGQLIGGNLVISSSQALSQPFLNQFGTGAFTISINGGKGTLTGSNGAQASYNPQTGNVSWHRTIQGPPTTQTVVTQGMPMSQGMPQRPSGLTGVAGITTQYVIREGGYYHGKNGGYAGTSPCSGCRYVDPQTGQVTYWRGHFSSDGTTGQPRFVQDNTGGTVVYQVGGKYYVTQASSFFNNQGGPNKPSIQPGTSFTPQVVQTVVRPGATTIVPYQETLPIRGQVNPPSGRRSPPGFSPQGRYRRARVQPLRRSQPPLWSDPLMHRPGLELTPPSPPAADQVSPVTPRMRFRSRRQRRSQRWRRRRRSVW